MGLMDKVKAQAEQALAKGKVAAEKGREKGQAKLHEMQEKRAESNEAGATEASKPDAPAGDYKLDDI
jgi:hypothetical protein